MSLINDALKRAKQTQTGQPQGAGAEPPLEPAVEAATPKGLTTPVVLGGIGVLLLAVGCFSVWWIQSREIAPARLGVRTSDVEPAKRAEAKPVTSQVTSGGEEVIMADQASSTTLARPQRARPEPPLREAISDSGARPQPDLRMTSVPASTVVQVSAPPELRLQAIHYRLNKPSAVVNNKTVFVGSEIYGARVMAIERQTVRLVVRGQDMVLKQQ